MQDADLIVEIIGWAGTVMVVAAFMATTMEWLKPASLLALALNATGSVGILVNSWVHRAWPSVGINAVWIVIALAAFVRAYCFAPGRNEHGATHP